MLHALLHFQTLWVLWTRMLGCDNWSHRLSVFPKPYGIRISAHQALFLLWSISNIFHMWATLNLRTTFGWGTEPRGPTCVDSLTKHLWARDHRPTVSKRWLAYVHTWWGSLFPKIIWHWSITDQSLYASSQSNYFSIDMVYIFLICEVFPT